MSVQTEADEHIKNAKILINAAIKDLAKVIIEECPGFDDFTAEYDEDLRRTFQTLLEVREALR